MSWRGASPRQHSSTKTNHHDKTKSSPTALAISQALQQNLNLQKDILKRLKKLTAAKVKNRDKVSETLLPTLLQDKYEGVYKERTPKMAAPFKEKYPQEFFSGFVRALRQKEAALYEEEQKQREGQILIIDGHGGKMAGNKRKRTTEGPRSISQPHVKTLWGYDEASHGGELGMSKKLRLRYFVDPEGGVPPPNRDTILRRKLESWEGSDFNQVEFSDGHGTDPTHSVAVARLEDDEHNSMENGKTGTTVGVDSLTATSRKRWFPWSKKELQALQEVAEEVRRDQAQPKQPALVHILLQNPCKKGQPSVESNTTSPASPSLPSESPPLDFVPDQDINFHQVALRLTERLSPSPAYDTTTKPQKARPLIRTTEECRLKYVYETSPHINRAPFTREETLKILAWAHAHHDQPPWENVAQDLTNLNTKSTPANRPNPQPPKKRRTPWQCFHYYEGTLNTKIKCRPVTKEEDDFLLKYAALRGPRLLLSAKGETLDLARYVMMDRGPKHLYYRGNLSLLNPNLIHECWTEKDERRLVLYMKIYGDAFSPMTMATKHFPERTTKSVWDKWHRCLTPEYDQRPFTSSEDATLLTTVERLGAVGQWMEICKAFPNRHPKDVYNRWVELSSENDLIQKHKDTFKARRAARRGWVGEGKLLKPDDFMVVRKVVKKKNKTSSSTTETTDKEE